MRCLGNLYFDTVYGTLDNINGVGRNVRRNGTAGADHKLAGSCFGNGFVNLGFQIVGVEVAGFLFIDAADQTSIGKLPSFLQTGC